MGVKHVFPDITDICYLLKMCLVALFFHFPSSLKEKTITIKTLSWDKDLSSEKLK